MKKLSILLVILLANFSANAQIITFTSVNFKNKVLAADTTNQIAKDLNGNFFKVDSNNNSLIEVLEAQQVSYLDISNSTILYMEGLQYFTNLAHLYCQGNFSNTTILDVTMMPNLQTLTCNGNNLVTLNVGGLTNLQEIKCGSNNLANFSVLGLSNLKILRCDSTGMTNLNLSGLYNLEELYCFNSGNLTSINFTGCTVLNKIMANNCELSGLNVAGLNSLSYLECSQNPFTSLNVSNLPALTFLQTAAGQLISLDVSNCTSLATLYCNNNQLTSINLQNCTALSTANFRINQLTALNLNDCINLFNLDCRSNLLTTLDTSNCSNLYYIYCLDNNLISMYLKNGQYQSTVNFANNPNLSYICCDDDFTLGVVGGYGELYYLQNRVIELGVPNCIVNTYCSFVPGGTYYTVQGNSKFDLNNNGCDGNDIIIPTQRYTTNIGNVPGSLVSNNSGNYVMNVQAGNLNIAPVFEIPAYFSVTPPNAIIPFPATTSPFSQNFCVTANGVHNDLEVILIPIIPARPGFNAVYKIIYKNKGNTTQSGNVNLTFNDAVTDLVSSMPVFNSQTTNRLSWNFSNFLPFETREITFTLNLNTPTDNPSLVNGDILNYTASVVGATDETPADAVFTFNQIVVGSFDPNDKTCLEGTVVSPSTVGQYVHYVIRFENTGTANAENIVVKDSIDTNKYIVSSLVPLSSSASYVTRITGTNQVEFIFENINLPSDDTNNDGYIAFKIKTKPTLVLGNTFSNSANIYFDYNAPIVTNTYTTAIQSLGNSEFDFNSNFMLSPVPAKNILNIKATQSIDLKSLSIYSVLGQLIQSHTNPNEIIDVSMLKPGVYFIKVNTNKGGASTQFIKE